MTTDLVGPEAGATSAGSDYKVGFQNIRPFHRQRAQPSTGARIGHAITAPVVAYREQVKRLPSQRIKGMGEA